MGRQEHRVPGHHSDGERLRHPAHLLLQEDRGRTDRVSENQKEALHEGLYHFHENCKMWNVNGAINWPIDSIEFEYWVSQFAEESLKLQLLPPRPAMLPVHHALYDQHLGPDDQKLYQTQEKYKVRDALKIKILQITSTKFVY